VLLLTALALSATGGVWADEDAGVEDAEEPVIEDRAFLIARKYLKADQFMVNKQPATVVIELHNAGDRRVACPWGRHAAHGRGAVGGKVSTQRTGSRIGDTLYVASYQQTRWCVCTDVAADLCPCKCKRYCELVRPVCCGQWQCRSAVVRMCIPAAPVLGLGLV